MMLLGRRRPVQAHPAIVRFTWSDDDMRAYIETVRKAGADPRMGLAVYNLESALNPHACNPKSDAQGLAQLMPATLRGLGYTGHASGFYALPLAEQLPWIARLIESQVADLGHAPESEAQWMHLQLAPANVKHGSLVYRAPSAGYEANKWLDVHRKGEIDEADLAVALERAKDAIYQAAVEAFERVDPSVKPPVLEPVPVAGELERAVAATELELDELEDTEVTATGLPDADEQADT